MRWNYEAVTGGGCDHHRYDYDYVPQAVCRFQPYEGMLRTGPTSKKTKKIEEKKCDGSTIIARSSNWRRQLFCKLMSAALLWRPDLDRNSFHLINLRYLTLAHNLQIFDNFVPGSFTSRKYLTKAGNIWHFCSLTLTTQSCQLSFHQVNIDICTVNIWGISLSIVLIGCA